MRAAALLPRPAKHLQDSDQQLLWLSRFRAGKFCRLRGRRARHSDRARPAQEMIEWLKAQGAQVIEVDTDGIYFVPPSEPAASNGEMLAPHRRTARRSCQGTARRASKSNSTSNSTPCSATRRRTTRFSTSEGEVVIKGGALKSRGLEKFQRVFLEEMIKLLMEGKPEAIASLRDEFEQKIREREWPIEMLMKTDTLQDSLEKYRAENRRGRSQPRRRLRARPNERPQLQAGRPDQLLRQSDAEKSRGLRSGQTRDRLRPAKPRRKRRLLRREAG